MCFIYKPHVLNKKNTSVIKSYMVLPGLNCLPVLGQNAFNIRTCGTVLRGNTHNDYLRYGKHIIHEGYCKYNTSKAIHYA